MCGTKARRMGSGVRTTRATRKHLKSRPSSDAAAPRNTEQERGPAPTRDDQESEPRLEASGNSRPGVAAWLELARTRGCRWGLLGPVASCCSAYDTACTRSPTAGGRKTCALTRTAEAAFQVMWQRAVGYWRRARMSTPRIREAGRLCAGLCRCSPCRDALCHLFPSCPLVID